jgi:2-oxo-4-hydroxy-4-carboxy-5-ureidoimidazoline decarboxylase
MAVTLAELNALDRAGFVALLGAVYEHSPWVAEDAWPARPFASIAGLQTALQDAVLAAPPARQLALLCAHPELLGKLAAAELTQASRAEQASAGLDRCTVEQRSRMQALNQAYRARFGFPFIVAVRGLDWAGVIARIEARLAHQPGHETGVALHEVGRIAEFRVADLLRP